MWNRIRRFIRREDHPEGPRGRHRKGGVRPEPDDRSTAEMWLNGELDYGKPGEDDERPGRGHDNRG